MKNLICILAITTLGNMAMAWEGTHPGLPPAGTTSSSNYSSDNTVYSDIYSRGTSINTKYGTSRTPEEIKQETESRRASKEGTLDGGPESATPHSDSTTY